PFSFRTRPLSTSSGLSPGSRRLERSGAPSRKYGPSISRGVCCSSPGPGGSGCRTVAPALLPRMLSVVIVYLQDGWLWVATAYDRIRDFDSGWSLVLWTCHTD